MTVAGEVVLAVATILSVDGSTTFVDQGIAAGLRVGDRGAVFYELYVGERDRVVRIPVSRAEVLDVEESRALVHVPDSQSALPGFRVEIEIPSERLEPSVVQVALAEYRIGLGRYEQAQKHLDLATLHLLGHPLFSLPSRQELEVIAGSKRVALAMQKVLALRATVQAGLGDVEVATVDQEVKLAVEKKPDPVPRSVPGTMARIPGGTYQIGEPITNAQYYDQQPRHTRHFETFRIDRVSVTKVDYRVFRSEHVFSDSPDQEFAVGLIFDEAQAFCRWRSARLPTEFEWEVAVKTPGALAAPLLEWTDSWYEPYPGNTYREKEYGQTHRVMRGMRQGRASEMTVRRFLDPRESRPDVGFRCATLEGISN